MEGQPRLPIGRSGSVEVIGLSGAAGHAVVVRQAERPRVLLSADAAGGEERLVVVPLDDEVEVRVDGDAMAVWLAGAIGSVREREPLPRWANVGGLALLLLLVGFAVLGSLTFFGWLFGLIGSAGVVA